MENELPIVVAKPKDFSIELEEANSSEEAPSEDTPEESESEPANATARLVRDIEGGSSWVPKKHPGKK